MHKNQLFYTYILICSDGTYYTGITTDLKRRIRQHNGEIVGGARYTRSRRPVQLHYWEENMTLRTASQREYLLKRLSHKKKAQLPINSSSPRFHE